MKPLIFLWLFNAIYTTTVIFLYGGNSSMEWWQTLLIAILPALITGVITLIVSRQSQINKNTQKIDRLSAQIGTDDSISLKTEMSKSFNSIISDIGRNDNSSLTKQHSEIIQILQKEISVLERRYEDEDRRIRNLDARQIETYKIVQDFSLFLDSWKAQTDEIQVQKERITVLLDENKKLKAILQQYIPDFDESNDL